MELTTSGFDWPVGTALERRGIAIPPGLWHVGNPFLNYYYLGPGATNAAYHTGADMTLEPGGGLGQPIYACANGLITFARRIPAPSSWGNLIIQRCTLPNGGVVYVRYAHVDPMFVREGDTVVRGQRIALESNSFGRFYPHLHFDLSLTSVLRDHAADWPGLDRTRLERDYVDPILFIRRNRPMATLEQVKLLLNQAIALLDDLDLTQPIPPVVTPLVRYVNVTPTAQFINPRDTPSTVGRDLGDIPRGTEVHVLLTDDAQWVQLADGPFKGAYLFAALLSAMHVT